MRIISTTTITIIAAVASIATIAATIAASHSVIADRTGYVASVLPRGAAECAAINTNRVGGQQRIAQFELCYLEARNR